MATAYKISIIVPVFNEEESLPILHLEIAEVLDGMGAAADPAEVIYVDDCSTDGSLRALLELQKDDRRIRVIKFRRNFGQTAAMAAGFDEARGRVVVTLDGDLQNDPRDIPALIDELHRGFDIVAGWRKKRHDGLFLRRIPSIIANQLIRRVTGVQIHDTGCTLKAFRSELIKTMVIYAEQHRFLPVLSAGTGAQVSEIVVNHRPRRFGSSKYGIGRAVRVLCDLIVIKYITEFSHRPIQYFGILSFATMLFGLLFAAAAAASMWTSGGVPGDPMELNRFQTASLTIAALVFCGFVYFVLLGLLAELAVKASGMHRRSTLDRLLNELHG